MPLDEVLQKLYARRRFGIQPGVDRVKHLLNNLGNPELSFKSIHVVGTNGKGSTSAYLAGILSAAGLRTALFTSPHLVSFTERFRIGDSDITPNRLEPLIASVLNAAAGEETFFEIVTAIAALYFAEEQVDVAVIEAGMGGRSDATAALNGIATAITPLSFDHCDYLGTTLEQIAQEKAGIARGDTPVIVGYQSDEAAQALTACLGTDTQHVTWINRAVSSNWNPDGTLDYHGIRSSLLRMNLGFSGRYQLQNATLALATAEILGTTLFNIPDTALRSGVAQARWPGRMEYIPGSPPLLLDGAHNPAGAAALAEALGDLHYDKLLVVLGVMADKDVQDIVSSLAPRATACYCVSPAIERSMNDKTLAASLSALGITAHANGSVADGIQAAQNDAGDTDLILVCGSLFTVGEAKAWLAGMTFEGIRG